MNAADSHLPLAHRMLDEAIGLSRLDASTREQVHRAGRLHRHASGHTLQRRGEDTTELLFVVTGSLEVSMKGADGKRAICWYLEPGQFAGMVPLIDGQPAIHDFVVHSDAVVMHIPKAVFLDALQRDRGLMAEILRVLCERSRAMYETAAAEMLLTLKHRTARMLLLLADKHGRPGEHGVELGLKVSQDDIAGLLGASRQSLNRELKALETAGAISLAYSRIVVRDIDALARLGAVSPRL